MLVNVSSKPMSILFIANSAYFLHHYYEHLLAFFTSSGYCVSIIVPLENNAMEKDFPTDYATYFLPFFHAYQFDGFKQIKLHRELKKKLLETKPSAIHSNFHRIRIFIYAPENHRQRIRFFFKKNISAMPNDPFSE
jgi:hypothetical protein